MFKKNKINWHCGYIFSREINNSFIPQKVQNLVIRDYAQKNKLNLRLSATEYKARNSFLMLKSLCKKNSSYNGIILYSIFMIDNFQNYEFFLKKFLKNKIILISALEEIEIKNYKDIIKLKRMFYINKKT
jgi:sporadic carbohydrate cluster protein (TIGR04323 family)